MHDADEIHSYLLDCVPVFMKYSNVKSMEDVKTTSVFDIKKTIRSRFGDMSKNLKKEPTHVSSIVFYNTCVYCGSSNVYYCSNSGDDICTDCARATIAMEMNIDYKDEKDMDKTIVYSYKRENHFNEWINQFQAKEITTIPPNLIDDMRTELRKNKLHKQSDITQKRIHEFLKKLGYSKYYEHVPYITTLLHGTTPPTMSQELESRLRSMFHMIQKPFDKFCPDERTNFLSYSYVLYKFCELLGEDEYLQFFPLLKSREKLYKHDRIWKLITAELRWEFIPTI
jgi:hypothetical protein